MIHIRIDEEEVNSKRRFACGIGPELPVGDIYYYPSESRRAGFRDEPVCPGCFPDGKPEIGTPLSRLSGRPGHPGYEEFCRIARSWGCLLRLIHAGVSRVLCGATGYSKGDG